ncbi:MAG TPA: MgtC/SapB family protein [Bryobacteraceae bacterium]|nr:MgtC/SapB family protein [Bryobacteraceae bacterium]
MSITEGEFALRMLLALGLGAGIGFERQLRRHEAGLKTNALVATGSSIFVMMASTFTEPDRIVAQVLPGIGFLGAGMIMRDGLHVRGLNTAATLWCSASIGTLAGIGQIRMALVAALVVTSANIILRQIAEWVERRHPSDPECKEHQGQ